MLSAVAVERGLASCIVEADTNADSEEPCDSPGAPTIGQQERRLILGTSLLDRRTGFE